MGREHRALSDGSEVDLRCGLDRLIMESGQQFGKFPPTWAKLGIVVRGGQSDGADLDVFEGRGFRPIEKQRRFEATNFLFESENAVEAGAPDEIIGKGAEDKFRGLEFG